MKIDVRDWIESGGFIDSLASALDTDVEMLCAIAQGWVPGVSLLGPHPHGGGACILKGLSEYAEAMAGSCDIGNDAGCRERLGHCGLNASEILAVLRMRISNGSPLIEPTEVIDEGDDPFGGLGPMPAPRREVPITETLKHLLVPTDCPIPVDGDFVVYRHFCEDGLLYVGRTRHFVTRQKQHRKAARWWNEITAITIELHPDEANLFAAEAIAIRDELPRFNKVQRSEA